MIIILTVSKGGNGGFETIDLNLLKYNTKKQMLTSWKKLGETSVKSYSGYRDHWSSECWEI